MEFTWNPELIAFRDELTDFIQEWRTPELFAEYRANHGAVGGNIEKFQAALSEKGWSRLCWPTEYGGLAKDPLFQFIFIETMEYWGMPYGNLTYTSIAPAIRAHGTEEQKETLLPGIFAGKVRFTIGYSEPNAGSDLASLRTTAIRVGDEWVINGQKIWTSLAEHATHIWLAVRTDQDAPRHQGISVLIVPMDAPGVTVRPLIGFSGTRTNETFYDDVRVPVTALVGELNKGWNIVMHALNHERVGLSPTGNLGRLYDELVTHLRKHKPEALADPRVRRRLAQAKVDLFKQRALAVKNAVTISKGAIAPDEASMTKIYGSELRYTLSNLAMDVLGRSGAVAREAGDAAPAEGKFESTWRSSPILRFGGGANELQRSIIATRGLGMPR